MFKPRGSGFQDGIKGLMKREKAFLQKAEK